MKLRPVARTSLVETVVDRIHAMIGEQNLQTGDRLPTEPELSADLGVSRTVLREAVGRLQTIGVLNIRHGLGMFVGDRSSLAGCAKLVCSAMVVSVRDWVRFAEFRAAIEIQSMRLAAVRATPAGLAELEALLDAMDAPDIPYMESVERDFDFHAKIVALADNELMLSTFGVIREFIIAGMVRTTIEPRDNSGSRKLHMKLVDALRSGDADIAEKAMRFHMDAVDLAMKSPPPRPKKTGN